MPMISSLQPIAKAIVGAVLAALAVLSGYLAAGNGFGDITAAQWVGVAIAFFVALGAVWGIPNKPPAAKA